MKQKETTKKMGKPRIEASYIPLIVTAMITVSVIYMVYGQTQDILKERLRMRLISIASTAALQFSPEEVTSVVDEDDVTSPALKSMTEKMNAIRESNENLQFIYIMRRGNAPSMLKFVADADMLAPLEEIDENENGIVDEEERPPVPGEDYDATEYSDLIDAFNGPTADHDLSPDEWGNFLSGYAPVRDEDGNAIAVLGIDVRVDEFSTLVRATFIPFVVLAVLLLLALTLQTVVLIRIWRNRMEIMKELDKQKDELLSMVSHQLATPVSSIKWYLEMLTDGDFGELNKEQDENITAMQKITVTLADLVQMILDVSRVQLGRMKVDAQSMNLDEFFTEILEVIDPKAAEKGLTFEKKIETGLPTVLLDKRYTRMTIENLLSNAIKYTPETGTVTFTVEKRGEELYCEVRDTGCGIPQEDQAKIFGKMFRASNVRNEVDGNGFGLYVAKGSIESQGGKIWFESPPSAPHGASEGREENKGTVFFVTLPLHEPQQNMEKKDSQKKQP